MPTNNQIAHVYAVQTGAVPTAYVVEREDGCQFAYNSAFPGQYDLTFAAGMFSSPENIKVTINIDNGGAPMFASMQWVSQTALRVFVSDMGSLVDAQAIWITVEIVPRVS